MADTLSPVAAAYALATRARFVYISTTSPSGCPETRIMFNLLKRRARAVSRGAAALPKGFASWVGTNTSSAKVARVREDPRACLYYADTRTFEGLCVTGRLEEVTDEAVRSAIYAPSWDVYYPGGKDGGDFTLFRFVPDQAKYYHGLRVVSFNAAATIPG